ncbi:MAG: hypothetical protein C4291_15220 [Candidatus Dadabacteria bacterium]
MGLPNKIKWHIAGEEIANCNCAWGCPCQFNALPTHGRCEGVAIWQIREGHFGDTRLDGTRVAGIAWWPGAIHEGNGIIQMVIDEQATPDQRRALIALWSGTMGGAFFEIFAAVCPNRPEPIFAPIFIEMDRDRRTATARILGLLESKVEPIKNPVTGEEHRARIVLPNGFEYKEAEMANAVTLRVTAGGKLTFHYGNSYAHLNTFDWSN